MFQLQFSRPDTQWSHLTINNMSKFIFVLSTEKFSHKVPNLIRNYENERRSAQTQTQEETDDTESYGE